MDLPPAGADIEMIAQMLRRASGFVYRCKNDPDYTMMFMEGAVELLTGRPAQDFVGPKARSYSGAIHADDQEAVVRAVDLSLSARSAWAVTYRLIRPDGQPHWVHETGGGVFADDGKLLFLEGIVVDHQIQMAEGLAAAEMQRHIEERCRTLLADTEPVLEILRLLRILAINARIEAARSGAAGAGFAVVAGEISRLADETNARAAQVSAVTRELQALLQVRSGVGVANEGWR